MSNPQITQILFIICVICVICDKKRERSVANLLLMRSAKRHKELAIRAALGASRWKLIRQLLVEGIVLAIFAAALGLAFVSWGVELLAAVGPSIVPRAAEVNIDARVFGFAALTVALISVGFGLVAARPVSKFDLQETLKSTRQGGAPSRRLSNILVILFGISASDPVTYVIVLLISLGSALLACSIPARRATRVDPLVALRYE